VTRQPRGAQNLVRTRFAARRCAEDAGLLLAEKPALRSRTIIHPVQCAGPARANSPLLNRRNPAGRPATAQPVEGDIVSVFFTNVEIGG
jgi:hypothetical protein